MRIPSTRASRNVTRTCGARTSSMWTTIRASRSTRRGSSRSGDDHWKVVGALTILDAPRPVVLDVQGASVHGNRADAHASVTIDRRDFGMTYAGFAVGKEVTVTIDAVGLKGRSGAPAM